MLQLKSEVTITGQAGLAARFPAFAKGFLGKKAKVIAFWIQNQPTPDSKDLVEVQMKDEDSSQRIWVQRSWLTCNGSSA